MPAVSNNGAYPHFHYSMLGLNSAEALLHLITHPLEAVTTLFVNHTGDAPGNGVKAELHQYLLISGLPVLFFKPRFLLMLIPVYLQKLFHDNYNMWGIYDQYSIEFAPVLAIGLFSVIPEFNNKRFVNAGTAVVLIGALVCTIKLMDRTELLTNKAELRIYKASHYTRDYSVADVNNALAAIPQSAVISAQSSFLAHLSYRNTIYQFPLVKDAEYIVYSSKEGTYPIDTTNFRILTTSLEHSGIWKINYKNENLTILKRANLQ